MQESINMHVSRQWQKLKSHLRDQLVCEVFHEMLPAHGTRVQSSTDVKLAALQNSSALDTSASATEDKNRCKFYNLQTQLLILSLQTSSYTFRSFWDVYSSPPPPRPCLQHSSIWICLATWHKYPTNQQTKPGMLLAAMFLCTALQQIRAGHQARNQLTFFSSVYILKFVARGEHLPSFILLLCNVQKSALNMSLFPENAKYCIFPTPKLVRQLTLLGWGEEKHKERWDVSEERCTGKHTEMSSLTQPGILWVTSTHRALFTETLCKTWAVPDAEGIPTRNGTGWDHARISTSQKGLGVGQESV